MTFIQLGAHRVVQMDDIRSLDCSRLEQLEVVVVLRLGERIELRDQQALDVVMAVKPSAVEGKRFRFAKQAWAFHNLVAHPGLQLLSWFGLHKLGFKLHDLTIPRPLGKKVP